MKITKQIIFHSGHMLKDDKSKCYHPHGHEYVLDCTVEGGIQQTGSQAGMTLHFGDLKHIMMSNVHDKLDHKFILDRNDPRFKKFINAVGSNGIVIVQDPPTAENLVLLIRMWIEQGLPDGITVSRIKLQETYTCSAEI